MTILKGRTIRVTLPYRGWITDYKLGIRISKFKGIDHRQVIPQELITPGIPAVRFAIVGPQQYLADIGHIFQRVCKCSFVP